MSDFTFDTRLDTRGMERDFYRSLDSMGRNLNRKLSLGKLDDRSFSLPLGRISRSVSEFDKSMEAANARVLAFGASTGVVVGLQRAFRGLVSATIEVEKELKDINVVLNLNEKNLQSFKSAIFDVANNTGQSFKEVAEGAKELSRQGLGVTETLNRLNSALVLSRLSGMGAQESVEALTAAINSYTKSLLTAEEIVNKLATVDAAFAVSSADLAEGLKRVGSSAEDAGVSFEELIALITATQQITNRGGTVIGNAYKTIFTRLNRADVLDQLEQLGIRVRTAAGETLPATQILIQYAQAAENLTPALRSNIDEMIGSVFQINQLKAIVKDLNSEYGIYNRALDIANQNTIEAVLRNQELNTTLDATLNKTRNNLQKFGSEVGNILVSGNLKTVTGVINSVLSTESDNIGGTFAKGFVRGLADFISGPGLILIGAAALGVVTNFVKFAKESLDTLSKTFTTDKNRLALNKQISELLERNPQLYRDMQTGAISMDTAVRKIRDSINYGNEATLQWQRSVTALSSEFAKMGIQQNAAGVIIGGKSQSGATGTKGITTRVPIKASSPIEDAIARERLQTGLPLSKIKVGQDPRLISPHNPTGLGVYNTRDEPLGLAQGIEREKLLGKDPKRSGLFGKKVPSFANNNFMNPIGEIAAPSQIEGLNKLELALKQAEKETNDLSKKINKFGSESLESQSYKQAQKDLSDSTKLTANKMDALAQATQRFQKDIFTSKSLDRAYENLHESLKKAGFSSEEATNRANEIYTKAESNLQRYNDRIERVRIEEESAYKQHIKAKQEEIAIRKENNARLKKISNIQKIENRGTGFLDVFGVDSIRKDQALRKIGGVEANIARQNVRSNFQSKSANIGLVTSIAAPIISGMASEMILSNGNTRQNRAFSEGVTGLGNVAAFAGVGGSIGGPYGAAIGGALGAITGVINVFGELNNILPDFRDQLRKTNEEMTAINDGLSRITQLELDLFKTNDPQKRLQIQSEILRTQADLIKKNITFDENNNPTNVQERLRNLNNRQRGQALAVAAGELKQDPDNTTAQQTLRSAFGNFQFDGNKRLSDILLTDPENSIIKKFEDANNAFEKNSNLLKQISSKDRNGANANFIKTISRDLTLKNEQTIADFFKSILPEETFDQIKKVGGNKAFLELFSIVQSNAQAAESLQKNNEEFNKKLIDSRDALTSVNIGLRKLSDITNSINLLSTANQSRRQSIENFRGQTEGTFTRLAGLSTSQRSILGLEANFQRGGVNRNLVAQRSQNFETQQQEISKLFDTLQSFDTTTFNKEGLEGLSKIQEATSEFINNLNGQNFDSAIQTFDSKLQDVLRNTGDGLTFGNQKNFDIISKLSDDIRQSNQNRISKDQIAEATSLAQLKAIEANLEINKKILQIQEDIDFGGGVSNIISGSVLESLAASSQSALIGNNRQRLGGTFELANTLQSLGIQGAFRQELTQGLADEIRKVSSGAGLNLSEDRIQEIAARQLDAQFKRDKTLDELNNQLSSFQDKFLTGIDKIFNDLNTTLKNLSRSIAGTFALQYRKGQKEDLLSSFTPNDRVLSNEEFKTKTEELKALDVQIKELYNTLKDSLSTPIGLEGSIATINDQRKATEESTKAIQDSNRVLQSHADTEKINISSTKLLVEEKLKNIQVDRDLVKTNNLLSSSMIRINAQRRQELIALQALSGSEAFKGNLFDSLQANALDFESNIADFGTDLGLEIKSSFKGAISSMVRDIDNFEDAAKQAFASILNKITDFGVGQFVDQGLSLVTNSVKGFNSGGLVTGGSGVRDDVPAVLQGGEYVIKKSSVDKLGVPFLEGLNKSSGRAVTTLQNAFTVDSNRPRSLDDGRLNVDSNLSAFALTSENNPQNQRRFDTESEFIRYIESLQDYEADFARAMAQYRKQKKNILTQGFMSAFFNLGAFGLSRINAKIPKKTTSISNGPLGSTDLNFNPVGGFGTANTGGMSKDTIPALVQGGEFIVQKRTVDKFGKNFFDRLNEGKIIPRKFATGGYVDSENRSYIQPSGQSQNIDFSDIKNAIMELTNTMKQKDESKSISQNNSPINFELNINIDKSGETVSSENSNNNNNQENNSNQNIKQFAELMRAISIETIIKEKRPNGLLSNI